MQNRRDWLQQTAAVPIVALLAPEPEPDIVIDPRPLFEISPRLYMQFMEPLGVTDSSVAAAWDYTADNWRQDFIDTVKDLAPGAMRFGGNFSRYYKWREGIGDPARRPWMRNYDWGGKETNRVGTHEFVAFSRAVGAEPFYCVNFLGDGIESFHHTPEGDRTGAAQEAADWVSYANDPDNKERQANGIREPLSLKLWQVGNETSYVKEAFTKEQAIAHTIEFARAMRQRDPTIEIIGWGDRDRYYRELWATDMLHQAGEHLNFIAIHMMGQSPKRPNTLLEGDHYQKAPEQAWEELLDLSNNVENRISELEQVIDDQHSSVGIAVTEGHLSLRPHNINPVLFEWLSAVYHARSLNIYQRHGAKVKIATAADFNGTRWSVMAVHTPVPRGRTFLLPVASIARLFKKHNGTHGIALSSQPSSLDIAASRAENRFYLHVLNLDCRRAVKATIEIAGHKVIAGRAFEIAPSYLRAAVNQDTPDAFQPIEKPMPVNSGTEWRFPAASVTAMELLVQAA